MVTDLGAVSFRQKSLVVAKYFKANKSRLIKLVVAVISI